MSTESMEGESLTLSLDRAPADSRRHSDCTVGQDSACLKHTPKGMTLAFLLSSVFDKLSYFP